MKKGMLLLLVLLLLMPVCAPAEDTPPVVRLLEKDEERPPLGQEGALEAHFLNVGWADCMLLRAGGETMLIDSSHRARADDIVAYLQEIGVKTLDYAFITHYHNDHIGGYLEILRAMPVGVVLLPDGFEDFSSRLYDELCRIISEEEILTHIVKHGDTMAMGDAELVFYQWQEPRASTNDRSMVLHASLGENAVLFAADIENNGQKALAAEYGQQLSADIIKMPHHGLANYTKAFHEAVQPVLVTYSNAKHKIEDNIKRTQQRGVQWLLTMRGDIVAVTEGDGWQVWQ